LLLLAGALAAGCGGAAPGGSPSPPPGELAPAAAPRPQAGPTEEQLAVRRQLLADIASGEYQCYCNSAMRARERIARGLAGDPNAADRESPSSAQRSG
jgi:hypothetical protein